MVLAIEIVNLVLVKLPGPFATEMRIICFQNSLGRIVSIQLNNLFDKERPILNISLFIIFSEFSVSLMAIPKDSEQLFKANKYFDFGLWKFCNEFIMIVILEFLLLDVAYSISLDQV